MIGTRLAHYEITSHLGSGGMGEVYQATDTKLGRSVAVKFLPESFAHDADRVARFEREARVLAALNHANIAAIYGLENADGKKFLVMELVPGETLAERIERGPIPMDEALPMAKQIAEALEAAHDKGVIHRDLKPANIKRTPEGKVKLLDFGLAKAFQEQKSTTLSNSPTAIKATMPGVILGTPAYMSPEQARGKEADSTSDLWSFGCVLYEMLTGRAVFQGDTVHEILADVMKSGPGWNLLPAETPVGIRRLLRRCLAKDSKDRLRHIGDALLEINEGQGPSDIDTNLAQSVPGRKPHTLWIISALALVILIAGAALWFSRSPVQPPHEVRFEFTTPPTSDTVSLAISPDGQQIVFVAASDGRPRLWLRSLDSVSTRSLAGTDGGFYPFWSPDSRSVGFFAEGNLKRIDIDTGLVQVLSSAPNPLGGTWNQDGTILFAPNFASPIFRVSSTPGGESLAVTRIEAPPASHRFPQFLPDGRHFLYYVSTNVKARGVYVGQLDGPAPQRLLDADAAAVFASSQHILFVRQGKLIAQEFDPVRLMLSGNPLPVAEGVSWSPETSAAGVSASSAGPIVYRAGQAAGQRQFVWSDRSGNEIQKVGEADTANRENLSLCERKLAMSRSVVGNPNIWILNLDRGLSVHFTSGMAADVSPVWSPDCSQIVFSSNRNGVYDLYTKTATGIGGEELLLATKQNKAPSDWSRDGRFVLYRSPGTTTRFDIWAVPVKGERKPFAVAQTESDERDGQFSPDGNWVAYQSNESGLVEIVIQPFPGPGAKMQISRNGGSQVRWRSDGKELFYIALDGRLMAVPIQLASDGRSFENGDPEPLFPTRVGGALLGGPASQQYAVSTDGQRFLMNTLSDVNASPISVIMNWQSGRSGK